MHADDLHLHVPDAFRVGRFRWRPIVWCWHGDTGRRHLVCQATWWCWTRRRALQVADRQADLLDAGWVAACVGEG